MLAEERPHNVSCRNRVAADASAGPGMMATLNRVEFHGGPVLAAGVLVRVQDGCLLMLWSFGASVCLYPEWDGIHYRSVRTLRAELERSAPSVEWNKVIIGPVKHEHRNGRRRIARNVLRALHRGNCGDFIRQIPSKPE